MCDEFLDGRTRIHRFKKDSEQRVGFNQHGRVKHLTDFFVEGHLTQEILYPIGRSDAVVLIGIKRAVAV